MSPAAPQLSIVVPAYNEELRLPASLERIAGFLAESGHHAEVIVVDDGSRDRTAALAESFGTRLPVRVLRNGVNRGKGFSVRHGMLEARGAFVLFSDADLSAPIEEAEKLIQALEQGYDVAIGSRAVNRDLIEVHESPFREFAGIIFNKIVRIILRLPFVDTQCGFKAFRRQRCQILFQQQTIERFGFDPELLYLARHHGLRSTEIPVRWAHSPATKVNMLRDSIQMFVDVFRIRWNALRGRYPRHTNFVSQST